MKRYLQPLTLLSLLFALLCGTFAFASPPTPGGQEDEESAPAKREEDEAKPPPRTKTKARRRTSKKPPPRPRERQTEKAPADEPSDEPSDERGGTHDGGLPDRSPDAAPESSPKDASDTDEAGDNPSKKDEKTSRSTEAIPDATTPEDSTDPKNSGSKTPDASAPEDSTDPKNGGSKTPDTSAPEDARSTDAAKPATRRPSDARLVDPRQPGLLPPPSLRPSLRPPTDRTKPSPRPPTDRLLPSPPSTDRPTPEISGSSPLFETIRPPTTATDLRLTWEIAAVWGILLLLALAWLVQVIPFLLPFAAMRFLSIFAHLLGFLGFLGISGLLLYRGLWFWLPGDSLYTGMLGFSWVALASYFWQRHSFPSVYLPLLPLLLTVIAALLWAVSAPVEAPESRAWIASPSWIFLIAQVFLFLSLGLLALAGSFLLTSGFLGFFAKRGKGSGYGLSPLLWGDFQLQAPRLALLAFPFLSLAVFFALAWTLQQGSLGWQALTFAPRTLAAFAIWFLLASWVVAIRIPRTDTADTPFVEAASFDEDEDQTSFRLQAPLRLFPSVWLLFTLLASAALFVLAPALSRLLQGQ